MSSSPIAYALKKELRNGTILLSFVFGWTIAVSLFAIYVVRFCKDCDQTASSSRAIIILGIFTPVFVWIFFRKIIKGSIIKAKRKKFSNDKEIFHRRLAYFDSLADQSVSKEEIENKITECDIWLPCIENYLKASSK